MSPTQEASALWNANAERGLPAPLCLCPCHDPVAFRADRISILVTKTPFLRGLARVNSPSQCRSRTQTYMGTVAPPTPAEDHALYCQPTQYVPARLLPTHNYRRAFQNHSLFYNGICCKISLSYSTWKEAVRADKPCFPPCYFENSSE